MVMTVSQIELAIRQLPPDEFAELSTWFEDYEAKVWDERIAVDMENGRLDELIKEAEAELAAGDVREL
jgi:hypothetical protein